LHDFDVNCDSNTRSSSDKPRFHKTLTEIPTGHVELRSKADSQVLFDDFRVEPL
jgi:hypothetical protein